MNPKKRSIVEAIERRLVHFVCLAVFKYTKPPHKLIKTFCLSFLMLILACLLLVSVELLELNF